MTHNSYSEQIPRGSTLSNTHSSPNYERRQVKCSTVLPLTPSASVIIAGVIEIQGGGGADRQRMKGGHMREKNTNHKHQFEISVLLRSTSFLLHRAAAPSHHVTQMMLASEAADILFFVCLVDLLPIKMPSEASVHMFPAAECLCFQKLLFRFIPSVLVVTPCTC